MEKKYRPGYKTLLTSLTIAAILSNVSMEEVYATEEYSSSEEFLELEEEVEPTEQEEVEPTEQEEVEPTEQEAIEHEIAEIAEQNVEEIPASDTLDESGISGKFIEGAQVSKEEVSPVVTEMDDSMRQNDDETIQTQTLNELFSATEITKTTSNLSKENNELLGADVTAPKVVDVVLNQTSFTPGETVTGHIILEDDSGIDNVFIRFGNDNSHGVESISTMVYSRNIITNEAGQHIATFRINIPENIASTTFTLTGITANDIVGNRSITHSYDEPWMQNKTIKVINPNESSEEVEERFADSTIINQIVLIDDYTGAEVAKTTITGKDYTARLNQFIENLNTQYTVEIELLSDEVTGSKINQASSNNYEIIKTINEVTAYIRNNSEKDISNLKPPFLPTGTIYDNTDTRRAYRKVDIVHNNETLHSETYVTTITLDESVRNAMQAINPEEFYYDSIDVSYGFIWTSYPGGYYSGPSQTVTVFVGEYDPIEEEKTVDIQVIPFESIINENPHLPEGEERVVQEGVNGIKTTTTTTRTHYGEMVGNPVVEETTKEPISEIIEIGTGKVEVDVQTHMQEILFETEYVNNPDLLVGTEEVSQEGINGVRTIVERVTTIGGKETNREIISNEVTTAPVNQVVQVGTKAITEETRTEEITFETEYINNSDLLVGTEEVSQEGINGVRTIVEEVTTVGGEETNREIISDEVTTVPVNRVVQIGTKAALIEDNARTVTEEIRTEEITFETEYIDNPELLVGTEEVSQEGSNGISTIVEKVTTTGGVEIEREVISTEVTTTPVNRVVQIGTKTITEETRTEEVAFEIEYVNNQNLLVGTEEVSQEGVNGVRTIVEEVTTVDGEETAREVISTEVTTVPVKQVVQVGTKAALIEEIATPIDKEPIVEKPQEEVEQPVKEIVILEELAGEAPRDNQPVEVKEDNGENIIKNEETLSSEDLPKTGFASTTLTTILGTLAVGLGSALGFKKKKK